MFLSRSVESFVSTEGGSSNFQGRWGIARPSGTARSVVTFAEQRPDEEFVTPVPPYKPLLRTCGLSLKEFNDQGYEVEPLAVPGENVPNGVDFFWVGDTLWATGVDITNAYRVYRTIITGAKLLGVTPEQLGDRAYFKNLNHVSDNREKNIELFGDALDSLSNVRLNNNRLFETVYIINHKENPKITAEDLHMIVETEERGTLTEKGDVEVRVSNNFGNKDISQKSTIWEVVLTDHS